MQAIWGVGMVGLALLLLLSGAALTLAYAERRRRRIAARVRVELPISRYSSLGVRHREDRERWGAIEMDRLHPLNKEEVERLLRRIDLEGVHTLTPKDRVFLDNMTLPRAG